MLILLLLGISVLVVGNKISYVMLTFGTTDLAKMTIVYKDCAKFMRIQQSCVDEGTICQISVIGHTLQCQQL